MFSLVSRSTKAFLMLALGSFGLIILIGIAGQVFASTFNDPLHQKKISQMIIGIDFALFLIMGFSLVPVLIRFVLRSFLELQARIGNQGHRLVALLARNQTRIETTLTFSVWATYLLGFLIASPYILQMIREV